MLIYFNRISTKEKRYFFVYALLTAISVLLAALFKFVFVNKTAYFAIGAIHIAIVFLILTLLFGINLQNKVIKKIAYISIIPFFIFCIYDFVYSSINSVAYFPLFVECLFFIVLILYFFFEKITEETTIPLFATFMFWIAVAFFLNFSGNFFLFIYSQSSNKAPDFNSNYTIIYSTVTVLKNIVISIAVTINEEVYKENKSDKVSNGFRQDFFYKI